ncbi:uncharacterized protein LOC141609476 [Silene latifolia]|uniref:uncharacterized protein LOC141609476 n=1 Tax=Silene latifolia TaxID=37657 RepID=UPI003D77FB6F
MMFGKNVTKVKRGTVDRISELPEFILHNILSMLDTKEAGRASVLSKRWYDVWSSIPVLDFHFQYFDTDKIQSFLGFIDRTMQRYFTQKYRIMKLNLELRMVNEKIELLVDKWLKIAVQNQVEKLEFQVHDQHSPVYRLPEFLFRAKSLKVLTCGNVVMPYYETMELISLEYLHLIVKNVDVDMFQRIITFCPLVELDITIEELGKISLPWTRKMNEGTEFVDSGIMQSNFKASPLRNFAYHGLFRCITWPWNMNVVALKNLRKLEIVCATITDDIVFELAHGLVALERLVLATCTGLKCIEVSSISLKDLAIVECEDLTEVTVDAPNLLEFWYNCELETPLSLSRVQDHCNAQFFPLFVLDSITTVWLVKLKKFLVETSAFKSLLIELSNSLQIEIEEEQLKNVVTGPSYKLRELKLRETSAWDSTKSSLTAFLDGLFWCCHPDILSITSSHNLTAKSIFNILKRKVQCYKHLLRSIEIEGVDTSNFLEEPSELEFRLRLSWF